MRAGGRSREAEAAQEMSWGGLELKTRTCGFCRRTIYDLSSVAMERVFACGGCKTRWTPRGLEVFVGGG